MVLRVVAIYPGSLPGFEGLPFVRPRGRGERTYTQVECDLVTEGDVTSARPKHVPPPGTPSPSFRIQVESDRVLGSGQGAVALVVYPGDSRGPADPEQRLLAPLYNNGKKLIFEFQRGEVIHAARSGDIHARFIAVDQATGRVGATERFRLNSRYVPLLARCLAHLEGTTDLFPVQSRPERLSQPVPLGAADLTFGETRPAMDRTGE